MSHYIKVYKNVVPKELCDEIVKKFDGDDRKQTIFTVGKDDYGSKKSTDLPISVLSEWKDIDAKLFPIISKLYERYINDIAFKDKFKDKEAWFNFLPREKISDSGYKIQMYKVSEDDKFDWHVDSSNHSTATRFLAIILYLNDVKQGGETEFKIHKKKVKPVKGQVLMFPTSYAYPHRGKIPKSNDKYIITTFMKYEA